MNTAKCRINNLAARNIRREASYQMVLIDLANAGAIDVRVAEALLGYKIPDYISLPKSFVAIEQTAATEAKVTSNIKKTSVKQKETDD